MWTISKLTFREMISKRIFFITIMMTVFFLAIYGTAIYSLESKLQKLEIVPFFEGALLDALPITIVA
ncbi:hypothetical protein [Radiobacillus deserti]|uniref:ABC transporter permease n=1 Tax=Radiobacillus deserti TaxID=2594883 RepID=A0A516KEX1_9BACI|nr:hypothetical protein [Radiobacillus deserti]QDP39962.1 hypothetical protein FN924_07155 [Radiobacillus deserti]